MDRDWHSIIYRGVESDELDYKAAQDWSKLSREGKAKFVRHCLAMANTKGGYVVVGVSEDEAGRPVVYTGLTEEESRSFDPSDVGSFVNRFADPPVDFTLERPVVDGKRYAVFVIRRFASIPHVCGAGCGTEELRQGVFYIRTADASSRPAFRSSEMQMLIQRALRNQREMLGRMIRGILYENQTVSDERSLSRFQEEFLHSRAFFEKRVAVNPDAVLLEFRANPVSYAEKRYALSELRSAAENSVVLDPSASFLKTSEMEQAYSTNVSRRYLNEKEGSLWQLFRSGLFHRQLVIRKSQFTFPLVVRWCTEGMRFAASVYSELGIVDEMIFTGVNIRPAEGLILKGHGGPYKCMIPEIVSSLERNSGDLFSAPGAHSADLIRSICMRFNFPEGCLEGLDRQIMKIIEKRA